MKKPKAPGIKRRITILDRMDAVKRLQNVGEERKDEIDRLRGVLHHTAPTNARAVIEHLAYLNHELSKMKPYK